MKPINVDFKIRYPNLDSINDILNYLNLQRLRSPIQEFKCLRVPSRPSMESAHATP